MKTTTLLDIPVDYTGCESPAARAKVRVKARYDAIKRIATQPDLLKGLYLAISDLERAEITLGGLDCRAQAKQISDRLVCLWAAIALTK